MITKVNVKAYEVGLVFSNGKLEQVLNEGSFWIWGWNKQVEIYNKLNFVFSAPMSLELLIQHKDLVELLYVKEVKENELLIVKVNDLIYGVYKTGVYAFWKGVNRPEFLTFNIDGIDMIQGLSRVQLESVALAPYVRKYVVENYQVGLLHIDGQWKESLEAGVYYWWKNPISISVKIVETRTQQLDIVGQELLTKDKATLRLNAYAIYIVKDIVKAVSENKDFDKQLYSAIQITVREILSGLSLDEVLIKKDHLGKEILKLTQERTQALGVEIQEVAIKDIILPGEMREIMNQVLIAEKKAQANVITRREETASVRSMLNTAKLMEENPTLWKLKEMEYMEKIAEKIGDISLSANGNVISQLKEIFVK